MLTVAKCSKRRKKVNSRWFKPSTVRMTDASKEINHRSADLRVMDSPQEGEEGEEGEEREEGKEREEGEGSEDSSWPPDS
mmetsp:Transcript_25953/g.47439  ORF Transcript_25953/g.47439 Transcript_25953/m.47439 type:complete len:80 (+) Transcript_25953:54-293(+)